MAALARTLPSDAAARCTLETTPPSTSTPTSTSASTSTFETLSFDAFSSICSLVSTLDILACACCSSSIRKATAAVLLRTRSLRLSHTAVTGRKLLWLAEVRMKGTAAAIDVSCCPSLDRYSLIRSMVASPELQEVRAWRVGKGSWTPAALGRLLRAANARPLAALRLVEVDVRLGLGDVERSGHVELTALADLLDASAPTYVENKACVAGYRGPES